MAAFQITVNNHTSFTMGNLLAAMTAWLCSDKASFSTGAVFDLSGRRATY